MQALTTIAIIMTLVSLSSPVQIKTEAGKHLPNIYSGKQSNAFIEPVEIYSGNIKAQEVMIDYSSAINPKSTRVEFMIYFYIGDAMTPGTTICFIRV